MNELIVFIKDHPHCTKWLCTTCGGLWGFIGDIDRWLVGQQVNLVRFLLDLEPGDLVDIPEWPVFLDLVLERVPKEAKDDLKEAWQSNLGRFLEFDIVGIRHFKPGSFDPCIDASWFNLCRDAILYGIQREERQWREIEDCLQFLGSYTNQYPEFLEMKQHLIARQQAAELYQIQHEQAKKARKEAEKQTWDTHITELAGLEPIQRLRIILGEYANDLQRYPAELTSISDEILADISDAELNSWINILKQKISRHGKGPLRDLRSRLYLLRQKRSGDEYRKQKGVGK